MKLITWNIWNYNPPWLARRQLIADVIAELQPDIIALQETRHDFRFEGGEGQGEQIAKLTGYVATSRVGQVYVPVARVDEGLTILTRSSPERIVMRQLTLDPHDREDENQRICLGVTVTVDGEAVDVFNTHFSLSESARQTNAQQAAGFVLEKAGDRTAFLVGDLNALPDSAPLQYLTAVDGVGFVDTWSVATADDPGYTWASYDPVRRIDYILARSLHGRVRSAQLIGGEPVKGIYPSDHLGILVELDL